MNSRSITRITHWAALIGHQELRVRSSQPNDRKGSTRCETTESTRYIASTWWKMKLFFEYIDFFFFQGDPKRPSNKNPPRGVWIYLICVCFFFLYVCVWWWDGEASMTHMATGFSSSRRIRKRLTPAPAFPFFFLLLLLPPNDAGGGVATPQRRLIEFAIDPAAADSVGRIF